jgi:hypothetical protein
VYIQFGLNGQTNITTPTTDLATTHTITIDPSLIIPGETYTYVVVSVNQAGVVFTSAKQTFTTKGLTANVGIYDKNHKPLRNQTITIHSTPATAKTDSNGFVVFKNLTPGEHHVIYTSGGKTYDQAIQVANNVSGSGASQASADQSFSVVYGFTQSSQHMTVWVWLSVAVLIIAVIAVLAQTGRLGVALQRPKVPGGAPLVSQPVVVSSSNPVTPSPLNVAPNPQQPRPGSTITPKTDETTEEKK